MQRGAEPEHNTNHLIDKKSREDLSSSAKMTGEENQRNNQTTNSTDPAGARHASTPYPTDQGVFQPQPAPQPRSQPPSDIKADPNSFGNENKGNTSDDADQMEAHARDKIETGIHTQGSIGADANAHLSAIQRYGAPQYSNMGPSGLLSEHGTMNSAGLPQNSHHSTLIATNSSASLKGSAIQSPSTINDALHIHSQTIDGQYITSAPVGMQWDPNVEKILNDGERVIELSPTARYAKLNTILGKGAYKVVYKAIDREEGYEVAWNCFQASRAEFAELSPEIDILKRVRHPNIINFHDCWYNNTEFIFVTELMTSGTLREYIRKLQTPNMKIVKRWARQILKGLLYLHSYDPPIIHRDIKCDNIFINGAHGEVKIGDMGTAKMKMGKKYTVIGTPEFMAPEMYEERGYSEKVDVYAFGMCLLEMVVGEYPYSECKNAAQIYKKVTSGQKPACLEHVKDAECLDLINRCLCDEQERLTVQQCLAHSFLAVEPEVTLLSMSEENAKQLTLQVVFRGTDKMSVKFDFNMETDTADDVVKEMIHENVLPEKYQTLITVEINKILRNLNKPSNFNVESDLQSAQDEVKTIANWKNRQFSNPVLIPAGTPEMRDELLRTRRELQLAFERASELEKKAELSEARARMAEASTSSLPQTNGSSVSIPQHDPQTVQQVHKAPTTNAAPLESQPIYSRGSTMGSQQHSVVSSSTENAAGAERAGSGIWTKPHTIDNFDSIRTREVSLAMSGTGTSGAPAGMVPHETSRSDNLDGLTGDKSLVVGTSSTGAAPAALPARILDERSSSEIFPGSATSSNVNTPQNDQMMPVPGPIKEYADSSSVEDFVHDVAIATNRGSEKAKEWLAKLQNQDIMTVGDLRDLEDDDWSGMGLTVFACRALRNALTGRSRPPAHNSSLSGKDSSSSLPDVTASGNIASNPIASGTGTDTSPVLSVADGIVPSVVDISEDSKAMDEMASNKGSDDTR